MSYLRRILFKISRLRLFKFVSSSLILRFQWKIIYGKRLNLNNPKTFSEKLQYLKVYHSNDDYYKLVDKVQVRNIIEKKIGKDYLIPVLWVGSNVNDIPYDSLPNEFVIKCNHGSHCNVLCKNKEKLNIKKTNHVLKKWLKTNWYYFSREYPYKKIKPQIIVEKYMGNVNDDLVDYKFFCFDGNVEFCQVIQNRSGNEKMDFFTINWERLDIQRIDINKKIISSSGIDLNKPAKYDEMVNISKKLSSGYKFARIDLYFVDNRIYFGEITFFPASGFCDFIPEEFNYRIGDLIQINGEEKNG